MTEALRSSLLATASRAAQIQPGEALPEERSTPGEPRHLRVVEPRSRRRVPRARALFLVGSSVVIAVTFGLVYLHVVMAQRQFQLDALNTRVAQAQAQYQSLRVRVAQLNSPQQIISTAEGKLGMRQPTSVVYLPQKAGTAASSSTDTSGLQAEPKPGRDNVIPAPSGDANWPKIKADLAGSP